MATVGIPGHDGGGEHTPGFQGGGHGGSPAADMAAAAVVIAREREKLETGPAHVSGPCLRAASTSCDLY